MNPLPSILFGLLVWKILRIDTGTKRVSTLAMAGRENHYRKVKLKQFPSATHESVEGQYWRKFKVRGAISIAPLIHESKRNTIVPRVSAAVCSGHCCKFFSSSSLSLRGDLFHARANL